MEFRTIVNIPHPDFEIQPCEKILFVGSCFADNIGKRSVRLCREGRRFLGKQRPDACYHSRLLLQFYPVFYQPAHTIMRKEGESFDTAVLTLGTNHVYIEKATGTVVDNCQKRPQNLFEERVLTVEQCTEALRGVVAALRKGNPNVKIILTVSPIRYAKYGYHESQLSKATLLLASHQIITEQQGRIYYFPAYEIVNDELRDYRFYKADMLHPNEQAVDYIWERFVEVSFSKEAKKFLESWRPIKEAFGHKPFNPESEEYKHFLQKAREKAEKLKLEYPDLEL